jgi:hypothetical protein
MAGLQIKLNGAPKDRAAAAAIYGPAGVAALGLPDVRGVAAA